MRLGSVVIPFVSLCSVASDPCSDVLCKCGNDPVAKFSRLQCRLAIVMSIFSQCVRLLCVAVCDDDV
jgi:hypothetical protein